MIKPLVQNKRKFALIATAAIAVLLMSSGIVYALGTNYSPAYTTYIESGSMNSEASYIIFQNGGITYARNGTTGKIDYRGTDATTVIQHSFDSANGGTVLIKSGYYLVDGLVLNDRGLVLKGESRYTTILALNDNANEDLITIPESRQMYTIQDIQLSGNAVNNEDSSGIVLTYDQIVDINNVWIWGFADQGIYATRCNALHISQSLINDCLKGGIYIGKSHGSIIRDTIIEGNGVTGTPGSYGIKISDADTVSTSALISGCWFESYSNATQYNHIVLDSAGTKVDTCRFNSGNLGSYQVLITENGNYNEVSNSYFMNTPTGQNSILVDNGSVGNVLANNILSGILGYQDYGDKTTIYDSFVKGAQITELKTVYKPAETQTLTASSSIYANGTFIFITSAGNINMTAVPTIYDGVEGQVVILVNICTHTIALRNQQWGVTASNIQFANEAWGRTLFPNDALMLIFHSETTGSGVWTEI